MRACEARALRASKTLIRHALPISLLILRKKPTVLQSTPQHLAQSRQSLLLNFLRVKHSLLGLFGNI